jgi:hypothetical protein
MHRPGSHHDPNLELGFPGDEDFPDNLGHQMMAPISSQ